MSSESDSFTSDISPSHDPKEGNGRGITREANISQINPDASERVIKAVKDDVILTTESILILKICTCIKSTNKRVSVSPKKNEEF
jgi:hypothetical protein